MEDKLEIHRGDKIIYDGVNYILFTQLITVGYDYHPYVSRKAFNFLLEEGRIKPLKEKCKTRCGEYDMYEFVF